MSMVSLIDACPRRSELFLGWTPSWIKSKACVPQVLQAVGPENSDLTDKIGIDLLPPILAVRCIVSLLRVLLGLIPQARDA